ncbi:MAG: electron transfer flavoprotein subunit beta/FixA family protein [Candidatus Methanomethylicia archaeon]
MLNMIVGIKWVPDTADVKFDPVKGTLIREGVESIINPPDLNAIELALSIKEKYGGKVYVISMSPPAALKGLKMAIAMGADKAILLTDRRFAGADTLATSYTLAMAIRKIGSYDIIIFGEETIDSATGHIGPEVGEILGISHISYIKRILNIDLTSKIIELEREVEDGVEVYRSKLPIVVSVGVGINSPRYPIPIRRLYTEVETEKYIEIWDLNNIEADPNKIGLQGSPTRVIKIVAAPMVQRRMEIFQYSSEVLNLLIKRLKECEIL